MLACCCVVVLLLVALVLPYLTVRAAVACSVVKSSNPATRGAAYLIPPFSSPNIPSALSATHSTQILRIT